MYEKLYVVYHLWHGNWIVQKTTPNRETAIRSVRGLKTRYGKDTVARIKRYDLGSEDED